MDLFAFNFELGHQSVKYDAKNSKYHLLINSPMEYEYLIILLSLDKVLALN
jgi:hypothetical protein